MIATKRYSFSMKSLKHYEWMDIYKAAKEFMRNGRAACHNIVLELDDFSSDNGCAGVGNDLDFD